MATSRRRWSPQEITDMNEWLDGGATLEQVGALHGISRERVRQLAGPGRGAKVRRAMNQERVAELTRSGLSDEEIGLATGLSPGIVRRARLAAGIHRHGNKKHTEEHDIWCAQEWSRRFGYTPAATDWSRAQARQNGHYERAKRFEVFRAETDCPPTSTIQIRHGSWSNFIAKTGLEPSPIGAAAIGRFSDHRLRIHGWRPDVPDGGWTTDAILDKAIQWFETFGEWPRASDWNIHAGQRNFQIKSEKFRMVNPPYPTSVYKHFESFIDMVAMARARYEQQRAGDGT